MIDKNTDFFKYVDNFAKIEHIPSVAIFESSLDYIPKITIAIPTYKRADLLKEAIDSAINQIDYSNYDIIVVDNNPERECETEQLMKSYNNSKISYYKNTENLGMTGNWNRLFSLAKGEYIVMLHDDDLLLPSFLKECVKLGDKLNADLIKPLAFSVRKNDNYKDLCDKTKSYKIRRVFDISNYYSFVLGAPTGCYIKKESVIKLGGFNPDFYPTMDYCFLVLFSKYFKCYKVSKKLSVYRIYENASFEKEVLDKSIHNDYFLNTQILEKYFVSKKIIKIFLFRKFQNTIKFYSLHWDKPNYDFDLSKLGLNKSNKMLSRMISISVRLYVFLWRLILKIYYMCFNVNLPDAPSDELLIKN